MVLAQLFLLLSKQRKKWVTRYVSFVSWFCNFHLRRLDRKEPHPADDLSGADVARKLTILSRHVPELVALLPHGYTSVEVSSLVPEELKGLTSADDFLSRLANFDPYFDKLRSDAAKDRQVLRFVGIIDVASKTVKACLERSVSTESQRLN